jgi:antitoxin ParD1/3/4
MAYYAIARPHFRMIRKGYPMPTRNVVLTERQEELLVTLVKSGRYQNASEVLRDGLRLVEQREAEDAGKLKALRAAARAGVGALDRGEFKEFGNIEELQAYLNDLSEKVISRTAG